MQNLIKIFSLEKMTMKNFLFIILFILNYSTSFAQLKMHSTYKVFKPSFLLHRADNKNIFAIVNNLPVNDRLGYQYETDRYYSDSTNYNSIGYRSIKIGKQVVLSQIPGGILAYGFLVAGALIAPKNQSVAPYIMYGGYMTGMVIGVHYFGNDKYEQAGIFKSVIGALIGFPIGYLIYNSDPKPHGFSAVAPFIFPTLGAVVSFNLSAKPK